MKKIISILFVAAVVTLVACGGKKSDLVTGSWKLADMTQPMPKEIPDSMKAKFEAQMKTQIEEMKKSTSFDFNKDGSFSVKMMGQENKGTWKLSDDGTKMMMTQGNKMDTTHVVELTASKIVLEVNQAGDKQMITLTK
ncbi:MAG TPA: DUF4923 family protein [Bacteroidia bacterium]|jgi:hypothetical protein|nr:DUF4923 family protein [Bacteroidia bacterium]